MGDAFERFSQLPSRLLLDTCVLNSIYDEGAYIWEGELPEGTTSETVNVDLQALRAIFTVNERASFQWLISPLTIAEIANVQDFSDRERRLRWVLDVLDHWLIMLDESQDRQRDGGTVRHRFKLTEKLQQLEAELLTIPDFRRDPFDRLLIIHYHMGNCDAFMTTDKRTIWKHRERLFELGINVMLPSEYWELLKPWARLWV